MKANIRLIFFVIPMSFLLGVWWSFYRFESQNTRPDYSEGTLHVLANKGAFPELLITEFEKQFKVRVLLSEYSTDLKLINEIYSNADRYDVIQVTSYQLSTLAVKDTFEPIPLETIPNVKEISPDFLNLQYDKGNQFTLPISWSLNGFLINKNLWPSPMTSLKEALQEKKLAGKIAFLADPVEFLAQLRRHGEFSEEWIKTESRDRLSEALKSFTKPLYLNPQESNPLDLKAGKMFIKQFPLGKSVHWLNKNSEFSYWIPIDKTTLWLQLMAISKRSQNKKLASEFLNHVLTQRSALHIAQRSRMSTVVRSASSLPISPMFKPEYLRSVNINHLELLVEHQAYQSIWSRALSTLYPSLFQSPKGQVTELEKQ